MNVHPRTWLVSYDIRDGKRLRRVYRIMRGYGDRLQYSVFLCDLSPRLRAELEARLLEVIEPGKDQVLFVRLVGTFEQAWKRIEHLGVAPRQPERVARVVGS